jgi:CelD/BcsL family acetyltransferase involved in cellulose biosynthesis
MSAPLAAVMNPSLIDSSPIDPSPMKLSAMDVSPIDSSPLRVELVTDAAGLAALRGEWARLADEAKAGTMFLTWEWLAPWWTHFGAGRELQLLTVRDGQGALVGLWPLFAERVRYGGVEARRLAYLGDGDTGCDHMDVLATPGRRAEVVDACLAKLADLEWDVLDLDGMLRESDTVLQLAQRYPARRTTGGIVRDGKLRFVCPHIPLRGNYEEFLQGLGRRENLRRREKWLSRQPGVSIEVATSPEQAPRAMEHFFQLHRARWAADGGSDGLRDERYEPFHRAAAQLLAERGRLRMYTLFAARRPVASVYGVLHGKTFFYYQSGYEPLWASRSVGLVLLARTVQDAFAEGLSDFDFLRGNEAYKAQWAKEERWTVQLRLFRGARGRAAQAAEAIGKGAREAVKSALPEQLLETARRTRRVLRAGASVRDLVAAVTRGREGEEGRS